MYRYVALLRGINVGGRTTVPMAGLRAVFEDAGYLRVRTYIQSGNVVFDAAAPPRETELATRVAEAFDLAPAVTLREAAEWRAIIEANPFAERDLDPAKLAVAFLTAPPPGEVSVPGDWPEEVVAGSRHLYVYYPAGQGRSKLTTAYLEKATGGPCTVRNWRTIGRIAAMLDA